MALKRYPNGAAGPFFFQKRAPASRPAWVPTVTLSFPSGRTADEVVIDDAAQLAWVDQPGLRRPQSAPGPGRRPRSSRRAARRPRPGPGCPLGRHPAGGARRAGFPRRRRPRRLAEDIGESRHPCQRPDRAPLDLPGGSAGCPRAGPRRGAARARPGHQPLVEGRAPRGLHRLQPEREGPHRRERVLRAPPARRPGVDAADLGRSAGRRPGSVHGPDGPGAVRSARRPPRRHRRARREPRRSARAVRAPRGAGPGRRSLAAELREDARRAAARRALEAADAVEAAHRDRACGDAGGGDGRARPLEGAPPRGLAAPRPGRRARRRHARPIHDLDADPPQP